MRARARKEIFQPTEIKCVGFPSCVRAGGMTILFGS